MARLNYDNVSGSVSVDQPGPHTDHSNHVTTQLPGEPMDYQKMTMEDVIRAIPKARLRGSQK